MENILLALLAIAAIITAIIEIIQLLKDHKEKTRKKIEEILKPLYSEIKKRYSEIENGESITKMDNNKSCINWARVCGCCPCSLYYENPLPLFFTSGDENKIISEYDGKKITIIKEELQKEFPRITKMIENFDKKRKEMFETYLKVRNKMEGMFKEGLKRNNISYDVTFIRMTICLCLTNRIESEINSISTKEQYKDYKDFLKNEKVQTILAEIKNKEEIKNEIEKGGKQYRELCVILKNLYNKVRKELGYQ